MASGRNARPPKSARRFRKKRLSSDVGEAEDRPQIKVPVSELPSGELRVSLAAETEEVGESVEIDGGFSPAGVSPGGRVGSS